MIDNRTKMVPMMYIGKAFARHQEWVDRLYGTGIIWTKDNNIQMVPAPVAARMKKMNPDCYREADIKDVKSTVEGITAGGIAKAKPADLSEIRRMINGLVDAEVLIAFAGTIDPDVKLDKNTPILDLRKQIIGMVESMDKQKVEGQVVDIDLLKESGLKTAEKLAEQERKEFEDSIAKQDLANIINGMDNKDSLAEYVMGNPDLIEIVVDKRNTIEKIKENILEGLRAKGKVY